MLAFRYDTQPLIGGHDLDEHKIHFHTDEPQKNPEYGAARGDRG